MKLNLNTLLVMLGLAGTIVPDLTGLAGWLAGLGVPWLTHVAHVVGSLALLCAGLSRVVPKLRPLLSALNLATAPGATAPIPAGMPTNTAAVIPREPMAAESTAGKVLPMQEPTPVTVPITPPRKPDAGHLTWGMFFFVVALSAMACFACILVGERMARAQTVAPQAIGCFDKANTYCLVPATALGDQVNLKDGSVTNGVLLVGLVLQHEFGTIPLGLGLYGGLGASTKNQGSYQGCIGVSITSWGLLCGGVQRATFADGSTALQGMLTFAGQLTSGGTPSFVRAQSSKLTAVSTSAGPVTGYPVDLGSGKAAK